MRAVSLLPSLLALAACSFDADYGTGYRCIDDTDCPDGQRCVDNSCQLEVAPEDDAGAPLDGAAPADAPGPDAALVNLIIDPGFEIGGDENWSKFNSTLAQKPDDPHGGANSGHVCEISSDDPYTVFQEFAQDPPQGATYRVSAWVRTGGEALAARVTLREYTQGSDDRIDHDGMEVEIGAAWTELSVEAPIDVAGRDEAQIIVWGLTGGASCFDIDDAAAYRLGS